MAAWELVNSKKGKGSLDLAVINPSFVIGPSLTKNVGTSVDICTQIMTGTMKATPHLCMNVVDVRDVAEGIVRAMVRYLHADSTLSTLSWSPVLFFRVEVR